MKYTEVRLNNPGDIADFENNFGVSIGSESGVCSITEVYIEANTKSAVIEVVTEFILTDTEFKVENGDLIILKESALARYIALGRF